METKMQTAANPIDATKTKQNLEAAFAGESMANRKYLYFAKVARQLGDEEVAKLFEKTAEEETGHAFSHLSLIYPAEDMTVERLLELAIEGERYEYTTMYPEFEAKAAEEGREDAVAEFREQAQESKDHDARFTKMLESARKRFAALLKSEKRHHDLYAEQLERVRKA
jgi:rubrerythrin